MNLQIRPEEDYLVAELAGWASEADYSAGISPIWTEHITLEGSDYPNVANSINSIANKLMQGMQAKGDEWSDAVAANPPKPTRT